MDTAQRYLKIYIDPRSGGPITPIKIDMSLVEEAALAASFGSSRDDFRARAIAAQISKQFPDVKPESDMEGIRSILSRLSLFPAFTGVVLSLPGEIKESEAPSSNSSDLISQVEFLKKQIIDLKKQLLVEQRNIQQVRIQKDQTEGEYRRVSRELTTVSTRVTDLEAQLKRAQGQTKHAREDSDRLVQEKAQLQTRLDGREDELSLLRVNDTRAKDEIAGLNKKYKELEDKYKELEDKYRRLSDESASNNPNENSELSIDGYLDP